MKLFHNIRQRLLLNYPLLFSTRVVPAIMIGLPVALFLFLVFWLYPAQTDSDPSLVGWIAFLVLCSIISVIVYLVYLFRFNSFKIFGQKSFFQFFIQGFLIFLSLSVFISWPFIPRLASSAGVAGNYSRSEIESDFEKAYITAYRMEYDKSSAPYRVVRIVVDSLAADTLYEDYSNNLLIVRSAPFIPTERFLKLQKNADTLYTGYEEQSLACSECSYNLVIPSELSDKIYDSLEDEKLPAEEGNRILNDIFSRYIKGYNGSVLLKNSSVFADVYWEPTPVCSKYRLSELSVSMDKIHGRLLSESDIFITLKIWFYFAFYATLLILIFRYMSPRTFLWTFLAAFLLFVFTVIISIIIEPGETGVMALLLFYYLVCTGLAVSIFLSRSRNVFAGIGLNLSFFFLHLLPFLIHAYIFEFLKHSVDDWWGYKNSYLPLVEFLGLSLVILSSLIFHSLLYYRWYSLPEE